MRRIMFVVLLAMFVAQLIAAQDGPYRFAKEIPIAGDGAFDYLSVDPAAHRLFVSHGTKIVVVDTSGETWDAGFPPMAARTRSASSICPR